MKKKTLSENETTERTNADSNEKKIKTTTLSCYM